MADDLPAVLWSPFPEIKDLVRAIRSRIDAKSTATFLQATVMAANSDGTVDIQYPAAVGSAVTIPSVETHTSYRATVGDVVVVLKDPPMDLVLGVLNRPGGVGGAAWQRQKLVSNLSPVTFNPIPQGARNLRIVWKARGTDAAQAVDFRGQVNGVTGVQYNNQHLDAAGAGTSAVNASAGSFKVGSLTAGGSAANAVSGGVIEIPCYSDTSLSGVPILTRCVYSNVASPSITATWESNACLFVAASPTPIIRIDLFPSSSLFLAGSEFDCYLE
jgi:hypothetical protein